MRGLLRALPAGLALAGCAASSGIWAIGPDTYALSEMRAEARGGGIEARRVVLAAANGFCQQQGRSFNLLSLVPDGDPRSVYWPTAFDATFQCLPASRNSSSGRPAPLGAQAGT